MKLALTVGIAMLVLTACSAPTEKTYTLDNRPTISFETEHSDAEIYLDGNFIGEVGDYEAHDTVLKVQLGTHVLKLELDGKVIANEKIFISNGTNKIISVP